MHYHRLKVLVIGFLIAYFVVGIAARTVTAGDEDTYPFFSWFLFSKVPSRIQSDYAIKIIEVDGKPLPQPTLLEKTSGIFNNSRSLAEYFQTARNLGVSLKQKQLGQVNQIRTHLEKNLFSGRLVTYEVLEIRYNPIERYKSGKFISSERIAVLTPGDY